MCIDFDCLSIDKKVCAVEPNTNCPCLLVIPEPEVQWANATFLNQAQQMIKDFIETTFDLTATTCTTLTAVFAPSESLAGTGTKTYRQCGGTQARLNSAVSATVTSTWCAGVEASLSGRTKLLSGHIPTIAAPPSSTEVAATSPMPTPPATTSSASTSPLGQPGSLTCGTPYGC
ncbi:uncharacterized protein PAC_16573 [Phialocephala subalpina]|uniref:Uncharacterized protein n=1 Tax=Phialocephala subalpina TaxID=576137 RepID=A0A1L7XNR8_9HELO|nr:uncharacterized protein PAC_16573 [Phialocephala subalpina]